MATFKPNLGKDLNIESIISAPLVAASKANIMMVTGQTRFLLEYCFSKNKESDIYEPVMIQMSIVSSVVDNENPNATQKDKEVPFKEVKMNFTIPLLCLVPLNSIVIKDVSVDFDMEITSSTQKESTKKIGDNQIIDKKAQLNGKISGSSSTDKKSSTNSSSKLKVGIKAGQLPLPQGVLAVIDLYTKTIQPVPEPKPLSQ